MQISSCFADFPDSLASCVAQSAQAVATILLLVGLVGYALLLFSAYILAWPKPAKLLDSNRILNLGIPISALAAYSVVTTLLLLFPLEKVGEAAGKVVELKAFSLKFTGPAGPVTLWIVCFLSFVFALRLLKGK